MDTKSDGSVVSTSIRAIPYMDQDIVNVLAMGGMTKSNYRAASIAKGVNTHDIHNFNVKTGYMPPDSETKTERERESKRVSLSRSTSRVKELVACNPWDYFVTITLDGTFWVRDDPVGLQSAIQAEAKRWTRLQVKGQRPYRDYKYLLIPDQHRDGSYHLHGFVYHLSLIHI